MTDLEALRALRDKVKAGEKYATMGHTLLCSKAFPKPEDFDGSREAYATSNAQLAINVWNQDSLDAALALHEAVLPEWGWRKDHWDGSEPDYECFWVTEPGNWRSGQTCRYTDKNPARAWLIAILEALIWKAEQ